MIVIDNGDAIRGIAEVASQLDFIVNGYVGTTATQLADGQLANTEGDLYASGANATVVTSITIVNTDSAARTFTLYLKPSAGTSRAITPVSLDLGVGYSFYTDGQRMVVLDKTGGVVTTSIALSDASPNTIEPDDSASAGTGTAASRADHEHAIVGGAPSALLEVQAPAEGSSTSFARADHDHAIVHDITDNSLVTIDGTSNAPVNGDYAKFTALGLEGKDKAGILSDLNVADGADVTGSNAPQAHAASHQNAGGDEVSVTGLSGLLADDQHVLDAEALAAAVQSGAITDSVTKAPTHDAVFDVKTTADAAQPAATDDADAVAAVEAAGLTFAENKGIILDAALSADNKWSGIVEAGTAGTTLNFGDCVYHSVGDGEWMLAKADVTATSGAVKLGINVTVAQVTNGQAMTVLLYGKVRSDADYAFTVDAPVFVSAATAGDLTSTAPTTTTNFVVRIVGYGNTADELFFCPDNTYVELA